MVDGQREQLQNEGIPFVQNGFVDFSKCSPLTWVYDTEELDGEVEADNELGVREGSYRTTYDYFEALINTTATHRAIALPLF